MRTSSTSGPTPAGTVSIHRAAQKIDRQWVVTTPRTRAGVRTIALPQEVVAALRRQRALQAERRLKAGTSYQDHGLVFANQTGGYQSFTTGEWALAQYCKRLGLPPVTPHGL